MRWLFGSALTCVLALTAWSTAAVAEDLGTCRFRMPRETHTIVFGVYAGSLTSGIGLDGETHRVRRMVVRVPKKDVPLFLVMTAYDPVEWDLAIDPGAEIAAVLVMGYHNQAIRNLPESVPHGFSTYKSGPGEDCPKATYAYGKGAEFAKLRQLLSNEFSREVDEFHARPGAPCLYPGCSVPEPPATSFWRTLFGSSTDVQPKTPEPPIRATTRILLASDPKR